MSEPAASARAKNSEFVGLWSTQLLLLLLSSGSAIALTLHVFTTTGSATALGLVTAMSYASGIYLAPVIGSVLDRVPRRTAIIGANLASGAAAASIAAILLSDVRALAVLLPLALVGGMCTTALGLSLQASVRVLRPEADLTRANSLTSLVESIPLLAGPFVGALVYASASPGAVFTAEAVGSLAAAAMIARSGWLRDFDKARAEVGSVRPAGSAHRMVEGFRFIWAWPDLRNLQLGFALLNFAGGLGVPLVLAFVVAKSTTNEAFAVASVSVAGSAGLLVGSAVLFSVSHRVRRDRLVWGGVAIGAIAGRLGFVAGGGVVLWTILSGVRGAAVQLSNGPLTAIWQERVPVTMQATVFGCRRLLGQGLFPVAILLSGWSLDALAEHRGGVAAAVSPLLVGAGVMELCVCAALASSAGLRRLGQVPKR